MDSSVVIPTFNERDQLAACLDALQSLTNDIETIVVNGPSTDGTSGMVQEREDVAVLLECASRNVNVARNVGIREATGSIVALLSPAYRIEASWQETVTRLLSGPADAVTGPVRRSETDPDRATSRSMASAGLSLSGGNLALTRGALTALDGFDEYLSIGGTSDLGDRIAGLGLQVIWHPKMSVQQAVSPDGGRLAAHRSDRALEWSPTGETDWGGLYRSLGYRYVKNRGFHPTVVADLVASAVRDGSASARDVVRGQGTPSQWVGNGVAVLTNVVIGARAGYRARQADCTSACNPHGLSSSVMDGVVASKHDWRPG